MTQDPTSDRTRPGTPLVPIRALSLAGLSLSVGAPAVSAQAIGEPGGGGAAEGAPLGPAGGQQGPQQGPAPSPFGGPFLLIMVGLLVFMVVSTIMAGRRQKKEPAQLMSSLKKHDRVQTAGGVIGSIVEIKDAEVVLRVDPTTNTRITFSKASVQQVLQPAPGGGGAAEPADD